MRLSHVAALALLVTTALPGARALAEPTPLPVLPSETVVLANGLRVLLAPDPLATLVSVQVAYLAGEADDPNGRRGLAHLTEHMVSEQTKHIPSVLHLLSTSGATSFNATTTPDTTKYFETVAPERLETALWVESERMGFAAEAVTEARVASERAVVHNEERDRITDASMGAVPSFAQHELFPSWHPYVVAADGDADYDRIGLVDVQAFLSTWYTPKNAVLAIAGRFEKSEALALVKRYFEPLPAPEPPVRPTLPSWSRPGALLLVSARTVSNEVVVEWRTPAFGTAEDAVLDLAAAVLAGPGNHRLARALGATHFATSITARQASSRQASVFVVRATCAPGVNPGVVMRAIDESVRELPYNVTASEVERARAALRSGTLSTLETVEGRSSLLVDTAMLSPVAGTASDWGLARYEGLTEADVRRVVATSLDPARRVITAIFIDGSAPVRGNLVRTRELDP